MSVCKCGTSPSVFNGGNPPTGGIASKQQLLRQRLNFNACERNAVRNRATGAASCVNNEIHSG